MYESSFTSGRLIGPATDRPKHTDKHINTHSHTLRHESESPLDVLIKPEGTAGTDDSLSRDKSACERTHTLARED